MTTTASAGAPDHVLRALAGAVADPDQVSRRAIDRHAVASDASHFLLTPSVVVAARDGAEVGRLFQASAAHGIPLTLRSGGTSLSGQGVTDGILVDVRRHFRDIKVLDGGARVRIQPGLTVKQVNAFLLRHGVKIGPDPASETACTIGGVVANNSSGMACGTVENTYRTLDSLVLVLPSGTVVDTGAIDADARLRHDEPELFEGLSRLRDRVRDNPASVATIRQQFSMKNTMGYGINSFLDFDSPAEILAHLVVGSEGTLGFIAEATLRTVPIRSHVATSLMIFSTLHEANAALPALVETGAATLELMDATSIRVGQALPDAPTSLTDIQVAGHAALLVEYQSTQADELAHMMAQAAPALADLPLDRPAPFSSDPAVRAELWKLRKGLYASVAGARPSGTTALLEDVVVPVASLADTCSDLAVLFDRYSYADSVIFGHAKDGNIHFMLTDRFETDEQLGRYSEFTEEMVDLILGRSGSLKAEHGTGRVMAPYVRRQYGDELYDVMVQVKRLCDPNGMLNPGVIIDDDAEAHLKNIKLAPTVESEVDRCVECGFCEPVCPSKHLTLTPRQRIVVKRAIAKAEGDGEQELARDLEDDYGYEGVDTCAVDGMCRTACPVQINTGDLVRRLRRESPQPVVDRGWSIAAKHWGLATRVGGIALGVAEALPTAVPRAATQAARAVLGSEMVPLYSGEMPGGGSSRRRPAPTRGPVAVYLPACVNTMFGPAGGGKGVQRSFEELCERAGISLLVPEQIDSLCCGTPWSSKGKTAGYDAIRTRTVDAILQATRGGELPVVCDASSCSEGLVKSLTTELAGTGRQGVQVVDAVAFVAEHVLPTIGEVDKLESLTLHPTCATTQMGVNPALTAVANAIAENVRIPQAWGCCAFAGDRGMLHPELTASATAAQAAEVREFDSEAHASCNRTCELGMTRATGKEYSHVIEILERVSRTPAHP